MVVTNELIDYIQNQIASGLEMKKVKKKLLKEGWDELDIDQAIEAIKSYTNTETYKQALAEVELEKEIAAKKAENEAKKDHYSGGEPDASNVSIEDAVSTMQGLRTPATDAPGKEFKVKSEAPKIVSRSAKPKIVLGVILIVLAIGIILGIRFFAS